ncbi:MAG: cellulase family glycosylhydrolase [Spirochaetales bacterium]|nr:cellulase family glycosylhydrolase [Spirochaetales bacterium]
MKTDGIWIKDDEGRTLILRGVNLGGNSKIPARPDGSSHKKESLLHPETVSFIGRPFPLDEADEHYSRLASWGLTFIRFLITWEAVEHAGPGVYDEDYLDYLEQVCEAAARYGIDLFIDPHNDMWSRWTGGDGAPAWTMELLGMDILKFHETGSAFVHSFYNGRPPSMIWTTNRYKLGAATMFTLFFGGTDFAPHTLLDGVPVQEFLQHHFIGAVKRVAGRLCRLPNVTGYDTLNEPLAGYIGYRHLGRHGLNPLRIRDTPTPFQSMLAASGYPQKVPRYSSGTIFPVRTGSAIINPNGISLWKEGYECIWKRHGVWTDKGRRSKQPELLKPFYFSFRQNRSVDFAEDYLKPFLRRFIREIATVKPKTLFFIEGPVGNDYFSWSEKDGKNVVNAHHWYDALTIMSKKFRTFITVDTIKERVILGAERVKRAVVRQLRLLGKTSFDRMGRIPTLIGEFGIPFDGEKKKAYRTRDFSAYERAFDLYFYAMDKNLLHCTLWNYSADNTAVYGDGWNGEDFSVFSRDLQDDPASIDSGAKALFGFVRPYAKKISGRPLAMSFNRKTGRFRLTFDHDSSCGGATEIFIPSVHYPSGITVTLSCGTWEFDPSASLLAVRPPASRSVCEITVFPAGTKGK